MTRPALMLACLAVAGCAQQYHPGDYTRIHGPEPTAAEIADARTQMMTCLWSNALQLDDQASDATTVGRAAAAVCAAQSSEYARRRLWAKTAQERAEFYRGWATVCAEIATTAVLQQRRARIGN